jgi:TIR domain
MDVILSWSGAQSRKVAETLTDWLKGVLPGITPWISTDDITKGSAWFRALLGRLEAARLCIICVTPENVRSPWLYFEAGAIVGKGTEAHVYPYLIGVQGAQLSEGPLSQFQWTMAERGDTWKLIRDINRYLQGGAHNELLLEANFDQKWPLLRQRLDAIIAEYKDVPVHEVPASEALRPFYQLSREAISLLLEAASAQDGLVLMLTTHDGFAVQANSKSLVDPQDARSAALWRAAVRQLLQNGLLEDRGVKGEVFEVTAEGYRVADELRAKGSSPTATSIDD